MLVIACFRGRGRSSGVRVAERLYEVYTLRNGSILRVDEFSDRAAALEAVGLREWQAAILEAEQNLPKLHVVTSD